MKPHICPVERAKMLTHDIRRCIQNPEKILKKYINPGMTIMDIGCGPGFFTIPAAKLTGEAGKVIAVDLQPGMLNLVRQYAERSGVASRVQLHQCRENSIDLKEKVDFALAFYMVHELPDTEQFFREMKQILKPKAGFLIVEPIFHVSKKDFQNTIDIALANGFQINKKVKMLFNRVIFLTAAA